MAAKIIDITRDTNKSDNNVVYLPQLKSTSKNYRKKSNEVYAYKVKDLKKIIKYFKDNNKWIHYLALTIGCNTARRIGDILKLQWYHVYNPKTGKIREDMLPFTEQKTDKYASPKINEVMKEAIDLYIKHTGCKPDENNYEEYIFLQLSGTYANRRKVLTRDGHLKALKSAAKEVGIDYNIGTHSARKFFGMISVMTHPGDPRAMKILQLILNHSDIETTGAYIGLVKDEFDRYYNDAGSFYRDYIIGDKEYTNFDIPMITISIDDLYTLIDIAYELGRDNANNDDVMANINATNEIKLLAESMAK